LRVVVDVSWIETRRAGHGQNLAGLRVEHDNRAAFALPLFHSRLQLLRRRLLQIVINRQNHVLSDRRSRGPGAEVGDLLPPTLFGLGRTGCGCGPFDQRVTAYERAVAYYVRGLRPQRVIASDPAAEVTVFRQRPSRVLMAVINPSAQRGLGLA